MSAFLAWAATTPPLPSLGRALDPAAVDAPRIDWNAAASGVHSVSALAVTTVVTSHGSSSRPPRSTTSSSCPLTLGLAPLVAVMQTHVAPDGDEALAAADALLRDALR